MAEDTRQDKRASFSAITEHSRNGMARTSAVASTKTGASKKIVIKNFKGTDADGHLHLCCSPVSGAMLTVSLCSNARVRLSHPAAQCLLYSVDFELQIQFPPFCSLN